MVNFQIDFNAETYALGVVTGWATAYGVYRARHVLGAVRDAVTQQAATAQNFATRGADSRYLNDLLKDSEADHLAGARVPLSEILVEPRFIPAPALAAPVDDEVLYDVFHVVPIIPDLPYLHAPYNVETLSIEELGNGDRALALLGLPGFGRTTALRAIALWSLGQVNFVPPPDKVQEQLKQEEEALSSEDRAKRIKERVLIEEKALQSLAKGKGIEIDDEAEARRKAAIPLFRRLTPVYAHLCNVRIGNEFGRQVDPAEPFVRAVQHQVRGITAKTIPRKLYERLGEGSALVLLDGFDHVAESEQPRILTWLQAFLKEYGNNFVIVTGSAQGYGRLMHAGFTPVFLRPMSDVDTDTAAAKWARAWPRISGARRRAAEPNETTLQLARTDNRARSAFDLTLKLWSNYEDDQRADYESWMRALLEHLIPSGQALGILLPKLAQAAALQLSTGYITTDRLEQILDGPAPAAQAGPSTAEMSAREEPPDDVFGDAGEEDLDALFEGGEAAQPPPVAKSSAGEKTPKSKTDKEHARLLSSLVKSGLLVYHRGQRFRFRHSPVAAYLASLTLDQLGEVEVLEKSAHPRWKQAVAFAPLHTAVDAVVNERFNAPPDMLQNHILEMSTWLAYAGSKVNWRPAILKQLGNLFVAANQYSMVRERIAAALVGTRDRNALKVFKVALKHPNEDVRRLSCLGIGALRAEDAIDDLTALLQDPNSDVQLAAGLALGAIGTERALEAMAIALTEGSEALRKAVAEAFAAIPEEGYPILYEAVNHEDMMLRRAAVYGLRRINTPWALIALYRRSLEDPQWYVRSAAEQAFLDMQYGQIATGPKGHPPIESIPWLREWINSQGENAVKEGQSPEDILLSVLDEGAPEHQKLTVANIGQLGLARHAPVLYMALRHRQPEIREAAQRALGDLQLQMGYALPSPV